jgi:hypothetical protein
MPDADFAQELQPIHLGHAQIAEREHEWVFFELLERLDSIPRLNALKPIRAHEMRHYLTKMRLVVDDQATGV